MGALKILNADRAPDFNAANEIESIKLGYALKDCGGLLQFWMIRCNAAPHQAIRSREPLDDGHFAGKRRPEQRFGRIEAAWTCPYYGNSNWGTRTSDSHDQYPKAERLSSAPGRESCLPVMTGC